METDFNKSYIGHIIGNMSYVPPHLRNKNDTTTNPFKNDRRQPRRTYEDKPNPTISVPEKTEENFPVLVASTTPLRNATSSRKFNELASDWQLEDDIRKEQEQLEKANGNKPNAFVLPKFRSVKRFSEPEDIEPEVKPPKQDDEWTTVNTRKPRKPRSERRIEEDTEQPTIEDDTVWEAPEEESCWDQY